MADRGWKALLTAAVYHEVPEYRREINGGSTFERSVRETGIGDRLRRLEDSLQISSIPAMVNKFQSATQFLLQL